MCSLWFYSLVVILATGWWSLAAAFHRFLSYILVQSLFLFPCICIRDYIQHLDQHLFLSDFACQLTILLGWKLIARMCRSVTLAWMISRMPQTNLLSDVDRSYNSRKQIAKRFDQSLSFLFFFFLFFFFFSLSLSFRFVSLRLAGFSRASYLKSKVKNKGACKRFWRAEKRLRYIASFFFISNVSAYSVLNCMPSF